MEYKINDYVFIEYKGDSYDVICKLQQIDYSKGDAIATDGRYFNNGTFSSGKITRLATPQEKAWLNACIKANRFIPLEEVNYSYEPVYSIY